MALVGLLLKLLLLLLMLTELRENVWETEKSKGRATLSEELLLAGTEGRRPGMPREKPLLPMLIVFSGIDWFFNSPNFCYLFLPRFLMAYTRSRARPLRVSAPSLAFGILRFVSITL